MASDLPGGGLDDVVPGAVGQELGPAHQARGAGVHSLEYLPHPLTD